MTEYMVWTLRHVSEDNIVTVALPDGVIPDDDWEFVNCQTLRPRKDSTP